MTVPQGWEEALGLPDEARVERRIYKKLLLEGGKLSPADRRAIQEDVSRIDWLYSVKPQHGYRAGRIGTLDVPEVQVIRTELRDARSIKRVAKTIHRRIPYPLLLVFEYEGALSLSAAKKRMSEAKRDAVVVERVLVSDWTTVSATGLLDRLRESIHSGTRASTLDALYIRWMEALVDAEVEAAAQGQQPRADLHPEEKLELRDRIVTLEREIESASRRLKAEKHFNRKVELGAEIKRLKKELEGTWTQLTTA